jgi:hypothetical protein
MDKYLQRGCFMAFRTNQTPTGAAVSEDYVLFSRSIDYVALQDPRERAV